MLAAIWAAPADAQDLTGHGGPVRALAADDGRMVSGGLDRRVIVWGEDAPAEILLVPGDAVTSLTLAPGAIYAGTQAGELFMWDGAEQAREMGRTEGAAGALAVDAAGRLLAAGEDGSITIDGARHDAHDGPITGLAVLDGGWLASIGADLHLRFWDEKLRPAAAIGLPAVPSAIIADGPRQVVLTMADGRVARAGLEGLIEPVPLLDPPSPLIALARGPDGGLAAASISGVIWFLDDDLVPRGRAEGSAGPVWALAYRGDELFAAGNDGVLRRYGADGTRLGESAPAELGAADHGANVWRACAVCHALEPGDQSRAGPSLHGIFGRQIATEEGYAFSQALRAMDIVWTEETISALFEHGPDAYTPGSRMPEQRLNAAARAALVEYLREHGGGR
ncbi:MAG: c-type cytochrome [Paracoccus sp. (in: a-proteobacteria)]|nr:c-type cytochrome [Paracoccus sp. (in: a-proteobacteria)]